MKSRRGLSILRRTLATPRRLVSLLAGLIAVTGVPYLLVLVADAIWEPEGVPVEKDYSWEPTVSVVLPTYNEAEIVESKLASILSWEYPADKLEIVVVDSSDDETPELVESFFEGRDAPELTLIRETERRGLAVALNEAYAAASEEVVVKTDCDSRVATDALREALATLAAPGVGAVTGRNAEVLGGSEVERGYRDVQARVQTVESHIDSTFIFHGPFSAFLADRIVPIDPDSVADDTELALRIRKNGDRVLFDPAIRYKEAAHSGFVQRRGQKDRRAMGLLRLLWRQRDLLGRPGYGGYGTVVIPLNWWFTMVSPWLVVGGVAVSILLALAVGGPLGLLLIGGLVGFVAAGARDALGSLQPLYSVFDTQISLARAAVGLLRGEADGTWEIDDNLREVYEE